MTAHRPMTVVRLVDSSCTAPLVSSLSELLIDATDGGASVGFMAPLARATADAFWTDFLAGVAAGSTLLLVAEQDGVVIGTVSVVLAPMENQPHRVVISKLLVHSAARGGGVAKALMQAAENAARSAGRTLGVLDTVAGSDADFLYRRLGWTAVGDIPNYALMPDGEPALVTFFYKSLA